MQDLLKYQEKIVSYLTEIVKDKEPKNLYEPVSYILELGGKRLRPILTLLAADAFNGNVDEALHAAVLRFFIIFLWFMMILWTMLL